MGTYNPNSNFQPDPNKDPLGYQRWRRERQQKLEGYAKPPSVSDAPSYGDVISAARAGDGGGGINAADEVDSAYDDYAPAWCSGVDDPDHSSAIHAAMLRNLSLVRCRQPDVTAFVSAVLQALNDQGWTQAQLSEVAGNVRSAGVTQANYFARKA